jgi:hypothetical protein
VLQYNMLALLVTNDLVVMRAAANCSVDVQRHSLTSLLTAYPDDTLRTFHQLQMVSNILQDVQSWHRQAVWAPVETFVGAAVRLVPLAAL